MLEFQTLAGKVSTQEMTMRVSTLSQTMIGPSSFRSGTLPTVIQAYNRSLVQQEMAMEGLTSIA